MEIKIPNKITLKRIEEAKIIVFDDISSLFGVSQNAGGSYYIVVERLKENFGLEYNNKLKEVISKLHNLIGELIYLTIQKERIRG